MQQFNSEFSKDLLDNSIAGIFITTLKEEVRYFNKSFAEIFRINDFMNPSDLNSELFYADISQRSKYIDTLVKSGSIKETVFHGRRLSGEFFYYRINSKLIENFRITIPENVSLHLSKAISFGLLISELISNSLKYGHSNNKIVEIHIGIEKSGDNIALEYSDKGKGLPENFDIKKSNGFGFKLILNLIKQLKSEYKISTSESFKFNLELKN